MSEACRRRGLSRSRFPAYKRRFQTHGLEGLKDLPPVPKTHPQTTLAEVVEKIREAAIHKPMWGRVRLSHQLKLHGMVVSSPTIQKLLIKHELGSSYQRLLILEEKALNQEIELTSEAGARHRESQSLLPGTARGE